MREGVRLPETGLGGPAVDGVDLLLFEIGPETYGADASQVIRIDRADHRAVSRPELGRLKHGERALVFRTRDGEGCLRVDSVLGIAKAPLESLRRLPQAASHSRVATGIWLNADRAVLLLDLPATLSF